MAFRYMNFFESVPRSTLKSCLWVTPATAPAWLLLGTPVIGEPVTQVPGASPYMPTTLTFKSSIRIRAFIVSVVEVTATVGSSTLELGLVPPSA